MRITALQVLEAVRSSAELPILMVSGRTRERDTVDALDRGADDYISKPFGITELLARVKALLRRSTPGGPKGRVANYRYKGLEVDFTARRARVDRSEVPLTRREFEVLAYFARNAGKILLHRQVLQAVCRADSTATRRTMYGLSYSASDARSSRIDGSQCIC